jgi:hypothetical protein
VSAAGGSPVCDDRLITLLADSGLTVTCSGVSPDRRISPSSPRRFRYLSMSETSEPSEVGKAWRVFTEIGPQCLGDPR